MSGTPAITLALSAELAAGRAGRLRFDEAMRVVVEHGVVWLTTDRCPQDLVLSGGESLLLPAGRSAVLTGLGAARVRIQPQAAAARRGPMARLAAWWRGAGREADCPAGVVAPA